MTDLPTFLAHAIALENEAAERYDDLAGSMDVHHNPEVAELFRQMAHFSRLHAGQVTERAAGIDLPKLRPWDYQWKGMEEGPETADFGNTHYLMTPWHCLQLALINERRGQKYYQGIADASADPAIRAMAQEMADEEAEHVAMLEKWLSRVEAPADDWDLDTDPPVVSD